MNKGEAFPTQSLLDIEDIKDNTVILKGGKMRQILAVSGMNFDLKSKEEQEGIIGSFQSFLNSLKFTAQIFIHSRKINIDSYLEKLIDLEQREENELLRNLIADYRDFIKSFIKDNAIMNKSFFVVVPYDTVSLSSATEGVSKIFGIFGKKENSEEKSQSQQLETMEKDKQLRAHIEQITQRTNQVIGVLNQAGLRAIQLNDDELADLFYNIYNPDAMEKKDILKAN